MILVPYLALNELGLVFLAYYGLIGPIISFHFAIGSPVAFYAFINTKTQHYPDCM
jgi:hypothetical protein